MYVVLFITVIFYKGERLVTGKQERQTGLKTRRVIGPGLKTGVLKIQQTEACSIGFRLSYLNIFM